MGTAEPRTAQFVREAARIVRSGYATWARGTSNSTFSQSTSDG